MGSYHELTGAEQVDENTVRVFRQEPVEAAESDEPEGNSVTVTLGDDDDEKSLKSMTKAELVEHGATVGVPADVAEGLTKAELVDAIERLTHTND